MNIIKIPWQRNWMEELAFKLLLGPQVIAVSTLLLATVDRTRVKTGITPGKSVTKIFSEVANIQLLSNFLPFMWKTTKEPAHCQTQKTEWTLEKFHECGTAHVDDHHRTAQVSNNHGLITLAPYRLVLLLLIETLWNKTFQMYFSCSRFYNFLSITKIKHLLSADHLVTVVLLSQNTQTGLNNSTTKPQHKVKSWLCWQKSTNTLTPS